MSYSFIRVIDQILEGIIFGFGVSAFLVFLFTQIDRSRLKEIKEKFWTNAIGVVRITGIFYALFFIFLIARNPERLYNSLVDSEYAGITIFMIVRSLLIIALSQLLWYKKVWQNKLKRSLIALGLFILSLFSNYIIERIVIITTSFHRDYWQSENDSELIETLVYFIPALFVVRLVLFVVLVLVYGLISKAILNAKIIQK